MCQGCNCGGQTSVVVCPGCMKNRSCSSLLCTPEELLCEISVVSLVSHPLVEMC